VHLSIPAASYIAFASLILKHIYQAACSTWLDTVIECGACRLLSSPQQSCTCRHLFLLQGCPITHAFLIQHSIVCRSTNHPLAEYAAPSWASVAGGLLAQRWLVVVLVQQLHEAGAYCIPRGGHGQQLLLAS